MRRTFSIVASALLSAAVASAGNGAPRNWEFEAPAAGSNSATSGGRAQRPAADATPRGPGRKGPQNPDSDVAGTVRDEVTGAGEVVPVHADGDGRCEHSLIALTGAEGAGFAAVWSDHRDGVEGLYFARLAPGGSKLSPDRAIHGSDPKLHHADPTLALAPTGEMALSWVTETPRGRELRLRVVVPEGQVDRGEVLLAPASASLPELGPALGAFEGGIALATVQGQRVLLRRFGLDGKPRGGVVPLNPEGRSALGPPFLKTSEEGSVFVAWNTAGGMALEPRTPEGNRVGIPVEGEQLRAVAPDPAGGWFYLVQTARHLLLRHRGVEGRLDRGDFVLAEGQFATADVVGWGAGVAVLTEAGERDKDRRSRLGPIRLHLLQYPEPEVEGDPPGDPEHEQLEVLSEEARAASEPHFAVAGDRLLVAWNEKRGNNTDIYYRILGGAREFGEPQRLNGDSGSSHQRQGDVDARGGDRAAVTWIDDREGRNRVYARVLDANATPVTQEVAVPAPFLPEDAREDESSADPGAPKGKKNRRPRRKRYLGPRATRPSTAMGIDGGFLVTWKEQDRGGFSLYSQAFDATARPLEAAVQVDAGFRAAPGWSADAIGLPKGRGFLVVWVRKEVGVCSVRLSRSGQPVTDVEIISTTRGCAHPSITALPDRRYVVGWDVDRQSGVRDLRGRFLREDGRIEGSELRFTRSKTSYDADPCVAPAGQSEFAVAWVAGTGWTRNVHVRFYARDGEPQGRPLVLTEHHGAQDQPSIVAMPDGSWIVVWRDNLSGADHIVARRVLANRRELGPPRRLHHLGGAFIESHLTPSMARMETGPIAVWTDTRRSKGFDVVARILGEAFDHEPTR